MGTIVQLPPSLASQSVARALDRDLRTEARATRPRRDAGVADDVLVQAIGTGLLRIPAKPVKTRSSTHAGASRPWPTARFDIN